MRIQQQVLAAVEQLSRVPFSWGTADCLTLCGADARILTGRDPTVALRGEYQTEAGSKRVMVARGWRNLGDVAASMWPETPPALARAGDWAWVVNDDGTESLGVVLGDKVVAKTKTGIGWVPRTRARRAFAVR